MSGALDAQIVADWLAQHPDFFEQHPQLLSQLKLAHEAMGTTSLIERQVKQLRRQHDELQEKLREFIAHAEHNEQVFQQLSAVMQRAVSSASIAQVGTRLHHDLRTPFDCQQIALLLFKTDAPAPWRSISVADFEEHFPQLLANSRAFAGKWRREALRFAFGDDGLSLSAAAIIPLSSGKHLQGVLCLGSTEASHFRSSMDTLFLSHFGDVLGELLARMSRMSATRFG